MRLVEAIMEANHRAIAGDKSAGVRPGDFEDSLPLIALTCIDPRLNPLMPEVLGVPEEHFIWLRNAGNILTSPTSSTMRSISLAIAVKGGKEIAVIGHTDCKVGKMTAMDLTDRFKAQGIERSSLPENLVEFFGMFASERQNVIRGVDLIRQSPLIGKKIPVHGLLVDIRSGKLEWVVNGYQSLATAASVPLTTPKVGVDQELMHVSEFKIGDMKFQETKIGDAASKPVAVSTPTPSVTPSVTPIQMKVEEPVHTPVQQTRPVQPVHPTKPQTPPRVKIDKTSMYKILGDDRKVYGPVTAAEIERWIEEGRIDLKTLAQKIGYHEWRQLETYLDSELPPSIPIPPALTSALKTFKEIKGKMGRR